MIESSFNKEAGYGFQRDRGIAIGYGAGYKKQGTIPAIVGIHTDIIEGNIFYLFVVSKNETTKYNLSENIINHNSKSFNLINKLTHPNFNFIYKKFCFHKF